MPLLKTLPQESRKLHKRKEKEMESRYFVFRLGGASPTKMHETLESARQESRRLCELNKGATFYVMRAIESVQYRTDPYQVTNYSKKEK